MKRVKISKNSVLLCPICGFDYNHHRRIEVFERTREDAPTYALILPAEGVSVVSENPSPRRNALKIYFEGECGHEWYLVITQHKGQTFIYAEYPEWQEEVFEDETLFISNKKDRNFKTRGNYEKRSDNFDFEDLFEEDEDDEDIF